MSPPISLTAIAFFINTEVWIVEMQEESSLIFTMGVTKGINRILGKHLACIDLLIFKGYYRSCPETFKPGCLNGIIACTTVCYKEFQGYCSVFSCKGQHIKAQLSVVLGNNVHLRRFVVAIGFLNIKQMVISCSCIVPEPNDQCIVHAVLSFHINP